MLGSAFARALAGQPLRKAGRQALNVRDPAAVARLVAGEDFVINCAAHTDVEAAERDPEPAYAANAVLPGLLAQACRQEGAVLVHMSSVGCYGDWKAEAYVEEDPLRPTTVHHRSKALGEDGVRNSGCEHLILRMGWLFGGAPGARKNFVWSRLVEARGAATLTSDSVQRGVPTRTSDVARATLELLSAGVRGTFNLVAQGSASRYQYVSAIVERSGLPCRVEPGPAFRRQAAVPSNETAVNQRLASMGLDGMGPWRPSLDDDVDALMASPEWRATQAGRRV
jgi:dTDP-4-dehydrorhamnose reductase